MSPFCRFLCRTFSTTSRQQKPSITKSIEAISTELYRERDLKRLVLKFKESSELPRFRTQTGIYENTVRRLASAKRFRWVDEIIQEQKKYNDISKEGFTARLITLYGKSGMYENAHKLFDELPERNCERTVLSFNALLGAYANSKKFEVIDGLFNDLPKKLSIEPDLVSYNTVIKAFCELGSFESATSMLDEIEKKGLKPDLITFNTLLNGFYVKARQSEGDKIWRLMEQKNVSPNVMSYNARLYGLALNKKTEEAIELFNDMKSKEIKPDIFSFSALIKGFMMEGKLEEAKMWYGEIEKNDCVPARKTFGRLIPFVCEKGDLDFALELCNQVFKKKVLVDPPLLQLVVDGLVKADRIKEAEKLVQLGMSNSYRRYKLDLP